MTYFAVDKIGSEYRVYGIGSVDLPFNNPTGSYNILKARLFGLSYPDYLRMARARYNAKLKGKTGYITEYYIDEIDANSMRKELDTRMSSLIKELGKENKNDLS